jgi:phosphoribosylformylglycinamidine synthase
VTTAAAGYSSSYGNQIGLATGQVAEVYHPGYAAKRMEIGAVIGATPAGHVKRERAAAGRCNHPARRPYRQRRHAAAQPAPRKAHTEVSSLETCGAEVQKGNAPVERKLQRLFRNR